MYQASRIKSNWLLVNEQRALRFARQRGWVLVGMERFRVSEAIRAYQDGAEVDLRGAAERAGLPVAILLEEMAACKVAVLDDPEDFGPGLEALRRAWPKDE